jgi:hypothetical protein
MCRGDEVFGVSQNAPACEICGYTDITIVHLQEVEFPSLIVSTVVVPGADLCTVVLGSADDVKNSVRIRTVLDCVTVFVVMPLLVAVTRLIVLHVETV